MVDQHRMVFFLVYPLATWAIVVLRTPRSIAVAAVAWCALWIFATTGLDDRTPQLDAWAIAHFGPVPGAREHPDDCFCPVASLFFPLPENRRVHIGCVGCSVLRSPAGKNGNGSRKYIGGAIFIAAIDLELAGKAP